MHEHELSWLALLHILLLIVLFESKIWFLLIVLIKFVSKTNYMDYTNNMMSQENADKVLLVDLENTNVFNRPSRCNHVILILCTDGEAEVEINYVTYKLQKNSFTTLVPLDIATLKSGSDDFRCKALLLPNKVYSPMIANLDLTHFKDVKRMPVITYEEPYFDMILQFFNMLESAYDILDYDDFEAYAERMVMASFIMQRSYIRRLVKNRAPQPGVLLRKKELFRKFIEEIVNSHTASREVLFYANELGVSCGYLNEVCNEVSTHSAKEVIDSAVTSRLKYELSYTSKTIQELADEYNFPSQSYFSRYFKRMTGLTPSEFRKKRCGL